MEVEILGSLGAADGWREVSEAFGPVCRVAATETCSRFSWASQRCQARHARGLGLEPALLFLYPTLYHGPFLLQAPDIIMLCVCDPCSSTIFPAAAGFFENRI